MNQLQRIVIEMKSGELVLRVLYRSKGDSNSGTKARTREVTELTRAGFLLFSPVLSLPARSLKGG
jgi:hypothetical protein